MNINRHNYENYLLLYVDNELSAAEKSAVDAFLSENPDLAIELELLSQTKLPTETASLGNLSSLFREEPIHPGMTEQMLLKLDGELPASGDLRLQSEIRQSAAAQKEWETLQKTKLDPADTIRFPYTESLYRHSGSRVVAMRFFRYAAAAAILGFGIFTGYKAFNPPNKGIGNEMAVQTNGKAETKIKGNGVPAGPSVNGNNATVKNNTSPATQNTGNQYTAQGVTGSPAQQDEKNYAASNKVTEKPVRSITQPAITNQPAKENGRDIASENINKLPRNIITPGTVELEKRPVNEKNDAMLIAGNDNKTVPQKDIKPLTALDTDIMQPLPVAGARTASISDEALNTDENDVLFLDDEQVKKSKLNGLVRKIKRNVERRTNIKTGNGIKIAGFEIAAR